MCVPVMQVGIMRVFVPHGLMAVPMGMRFDHFAFMIVSVMFIMHVPVLVFHFAVDMLMLMPFSQVKPCTEGHQRSGYKDDGGKGVPRKMAAVRAPMNGAVP